MSINNDLPPAGQSHVARPDRGDELVQLKELWLQLPRPEQEAWIQFFSSGKPLSAIRRRIRSKLNFHLRDDWELVSFGIWVRLREDTNQLRNN